MKEHSISQVPVISSGEIIGVISEAKVLRPLFESQISLRDNVVVAAERNFEIVDSNELLEKVANNLLDKKTVVVKSGDELVAILTDIDILNYLQSKTF